MGHQPRLYAAYVALFIVIPAVTAAAQGVIADKAYNVPPGKVVNVRPGNSAILVERFTMGDDSHLVISSDTQFFAIRAKTADIGNRSTISGRGHDGAAAKVPGDNGGPGEPGPILVLIFEKADIQGLRVIALGGAGGQGGKGTTGRQGRNPSCLGSGAIRSGPGGRGGDGGAGGDGGNIVLVLPSGANAYGIELNANSGDRGDRGEGGDGGPPIHGIDCILWKRGGEPPGPLGPKGNPGALGRRGTVQWRHLKDFTPAMVVEELRETASLLQKGGDIDSAAALEAFLDTGVLATQ